MIKDLNLVIFIILKIKYNILFLKKNLKLIDQFNIDEDLDDDII